MTTTTNISKQDFSAQELQCWKYLDAFNNCLVREAKREMFPNGATRTYFTVACSSMVFRTLKSEGKYRIIPALRGDEIEVWVFDSTKAA